eukprot:COSAG02_NODE_11932_length_1629_cov_1.354248_1_plen_425_part_01
MWVCGGGGGRLFGGGMSVRNAVGAGDVCMVVSETTPVLGGSDAHAPVIGHLARGDLVTVSRVAAMSAEGARAEAPRLMCFEMSDGSEAWCLLDDNIEVIPDTADDLMDKILNITGSQVGDEPETPAAAGDLAHKEDSVEPGAVLTHTTSVHGPGYDMLVEQGVPRRMLKRAWVMGGGDVDSAMAFIRANFDQPDEFWGPGDHIDRPPTMDPGAELQRQSSSAAPALAALQRLESGSLPQSTLQAIRNALNSEEMTLLQRRMPSLFGKPGSAGQKPDRSIEPKTDGGSIGRLFSAPPTLSHSNDTPHGPSSSSGQEPAGASVATWGSLQAPLHRLLNEVTLPTPASAEDSSQTTDTEGGWMRQLAVGSYVEVDLNTWPAQVSEEIRRRKATGRHRRVPVISTQRVRPPSLFDSLGFRSGRDELRMD